MEKKKNETQLDKSILRINSKRPPKTLSKTPKETQSHIYIEKYILILKKPIKRKRERESKGIYLSIVVEQLVLKPFLIG